MTLRERINADFITAMKNKDENSKMALNSIKAAITVSEKNDNNWIPTDDEIIKIVNKGIKQREDSIKMYEKANREDLVRKESNEISVLRNYMPSQMDEQEISDALSQIMKEFSETIKNPQALIGKSIGEFNKKYQGRADIGIIKNIANQLVEV